MLGTSRKQGYRTFIYMHKHSSDLHLQASISFTILKEVKDQQIELLIPATCTTKCQSLPIDQFSEVEIN